MKKIILNLTLLLAFSTNINANEIIYEKSSSTKQLEDLSKWYFNNLEEKKQEEKISKNKTNLNTYNSNNVQTIDSNTQKNIYEPNYDIDDKSNKRLTKKEIIEQYNEAMILLSNKKTNEAKPIFDSLCKENFKAACKRLERLERL